MSNNPSQRTAMASADQSFTQLIRSTLQAVRDSDLDTEMQLRAKLGHSFRLDHRQVTASLFRLLVEQSADESPPADFSDQTLDLDQVEGMDELLPGFIPANDQALIYGKAGSGKTMACLAAAFALIDGVGFLDHDAKADPGKALFIASDSGPSPLKSALYDLGLADHPGVRSGPDQRFFVWSHDAKQGLPTWTASISHWIQLLDIIQAKGIDLVLIDSAKAVCSQADPVLSYADNESVSAMLTFVKTVICRYAAVVWISHDGTEKGSHAGAKAWAEVPSVVHRIERQPEKQSQPARLWTVVKNRMGPERQFTYTLNPDGVLEVCQGVEVVRDARQAILTVLTEAVGRGHSSLSRQGLLDEIGQRFRFSKGTIDNSLSQMARAKHPDICRVKSPRGHYKLSPACLQRLNRDSSQGKPKSQESEPPLKGAHIKMNEYDEKQVLDLDLLTSLQVHSLTQVNSETSSSSSHMKTHVNSEKACTEQASSHVHSRDRGIYVEPEKSEAVSTSSQKLSHPLAGQGQAGRSADPTGDAAPLADPSDLDHSPGSSSPSAAPADLLPRQDQQFQSNPVRGSAAPLADDLAAFLDSTQPSPLPTDQDETQHQGQDTLAAAGDLETSPTEQQLEHLELLLEINTWQFLEQLYLAPAPEHPVDQPEPINPASAQPITSPAPATPAASDPDAWASALPRHMQVSLKLNLKHPGEIPAVLINRVYRHDPSMPDSFSGCDLKTFLALPEATAWLTAHRPSKPQ